MIFREICCPICLQSFKNKIWKKWVEGNHEFNVSICKNCGFVYQNPRIRKEDLNIFYNIYHYTRDQHSGKCFDESYQYYKSVSKAKHIFSFIKNNLPYKEYINVLEIGSCQGHLLCELEKEIGSVCNINRLNGIDPDDYSCEMARRKRLNIFEGYFDEYIFNKDIKYDVIIICHTLEHFYDFYDFKNNLHKILNPGGIVYVEVPNIFTGLSRHYSKDFFVPEHFSYFSKNSLKNVFNDFELIKIKSSIKYGNIKAIFGFTVPEINKKNPILKDNYKFIPFRVWLSNIYKAINK